jgi:multiple antibiotic resistance protein
MARRSNVVHALFAAACVVAVSALPAFAEVPEQPGAHQVDLARVFTFFFLTLGPKNVIGPFVRMTAAQPGSARVRVALLATFVALVSVAVAATLGVRILSTWGISPGALQIAAGIILFLVSLQSIRDQYDAAGAKAPPPADGPVDVRRIAFQLAFPHIVAPYGVAVVILVLAMRPEHVAPDPIYAMLAGIMLLNMGTMFIAHRIARSALVAPLLAILASVLAVLQAAFGVQAVIAGLRLVGIA